MKRPVPTKPPHPNDARALGPRDQMPWDRDDAAEKPATREVQRELFAVPRTKIKRPW